MNNKLADLINKYNLQYKCNMEISTALHGAAEVKVPNQIFFNFMSDLKDELEIDFLSCISGLDWVKHLEAVYHLYSYKTKDKFVIRVDIDREDPVVASVTSIWLAANWLERETYDMYGIIFDGHPDLKRILLADDFPGFIHRKDYPIGNDEEFILRENNKVF